MSEYQAIYDAVRSRISGCDMGSIIERVAREAMDFSFASSLAQEQISLVGYEMSRPAAIFRPKIYIDGNKWCALYGDNLLDGVAGFGDSPQEAMDNFDKMWGSKLGNK